MYLFKGLVLILLLLVVAGAEGVDEPVGTLSSRGNKKLKQRVSDLEEEVQKLKDLIIVLNNIDDSLTGEIHKNKKQIAFSGTIGRNIPGSWKGHVIKFRVITSNIGNAYNVDTGIFTCPVSGMYLLSCSILGTAPGFVAVAIYQNGHPRARPQTSRSVSGHGTGSDTVVVHAKDGDKIDVRISDGNSKLLDHVSKCTWVLLKTD